MKFYIFLFLTVFSNLLIAQTIADARAQSEGTIVTVTGIVTNGSEMPVVRYMQDSTAGIAIYDNLLEDVDRGDSITVTGKLDIFNGLLEVVDVTFTNHGQSNQIIPALSTPNDVTESNEAELLKIENAIFSDGGGFFDEGTFEFESGGQTSIIFVKSGSPFDGQLIPTAPITIVGISSQFEGQNPPGYQLLPRDLNDFIYSNEIIITSALTQENITTSSFDINWTTNLSGSTMAYYGTTPNLELGTLDQESEGTDHILNVTNLEPGSIYYLKAFSINETDTAFSALTAFATESNSTGQILAYFNKDVDITATTVEEAQNIGAFINDTIKAYIDKAMVTLDVAVYNHSDALITSAINDAYERGVRVRYITCESTSTTALGDLNENIEVLQRPEGSGIMHNKFVIIDANEVNNSWIITGSTNWTSDQLFNDYNHLVIVQDQSVAKTYQIEFNEMWGSNDEMPNAQNAKFGPAKSNNTPHHFIVDGKSMEVYFSPSDNTTNNIANAVKSGDEEIQFGLLVFTNNTLGSTILERYNAGVDIKGIIEQVNTNGSEYEFLVDAGVNVESHGGIPNSFHHKYCLVDQSYPNSDPLTITGSHNWSGIAETGNDENTIIIHDANITNQFYQEFINEFNALTETDTTDTEPTQIIENQNNKLNLFPNPTNGNFDIVLDAENVKNQSIQIHNNSGQLLFNENYRLTTGSNKIRIEERFTAGIYIVSIGNTKLKLVVN
ncbi:MAG: phospholipase D-like domain-containing protein [Flavobacteriales bacterium]